MRLTKKLRTAAAHYMRLSTRLAHPAGEFDSAGRWYPTPAEEGDCCAQIRRPSRAYPYALLTHCRSIQHVAAAHGYTPQQLRWAIKRLKTEEAYRRHSVLRRFQCETRSTVPGQEYVVVNESYGDGVTVTFDELRDVLRMFQADDPTINDLYLVVDGAAVVELSEDDPDHRVLVADTQEA